MRNARGVQIAGLAACVALILASSTFSTPINRGRESLNMIGSETPVENAPPEYAFAIQAFGAFRSLLTNIAFIRAEELKSQGRFYDAMQLADWICKLQPRFPSVWEFQSWNMAWNISVTTYTPEERWNWVYNGVKLIRDQGLRFNPRAVNLYRQVAWIFNNKMGENIDEFHMAYKREWAWRMHLLLGQPPDPLGDYGWRVPEEWLERSDPQDPLLDTALLERRRKDLEKGIQTALPYYQELQQRMTQEPERDLTPYEIVKWAAWQKVNEIASAPDDLEGLFAAHPALRDAVRTLRDVGVGISDDALTEEVYWRRDGLAFAFFERWRKLTDPPTTLARARVNAETDPDQHRLERFDQVLGVRGGSAEGQALLRFLQKKVLREVYKLDSKHMLFLIEKFGPMDWRIVDAHALYWVTQAIIQGRETINQFGNDKTNTARLIFFSLRNLYLRNKLIFEPFPPAIKFSYINFAPDPNFVEPLHQAFLLYGPMLDPDPAGVPGAGDTYKTAHVNFLTESIRMLYLSERRAEAELYYEFLRETYAVNDAGEIEARYMLPLEEYVRASFYEGIEGPRETELAINSLIWSAYDELATGDFVRYNNLVRFALDLHRKYIEERSEISIDARLHMPPFHEMQLDVLRFWLTQPLPPPNGTVYKAHAWQNLVKWQQQFVYDDVIQRLRAECQIAGLDPALAFPEPEGMDEIRKQRPQRGPQVREDPVYTPPRRNQ